MYCMYIYIYISRLLKKKLIGLESTQHLPRMEVTSRLEYFNVKVEMEMEMEAEK